GRGGGACLEGRDRARPAERPGASRPRTVPRTAAAHARSVDGAGSSGAPDPRERPLRIRVRGGAERGGTAEAGDGNAPARALAPSVRPRHAVCADHLLSPVGQYGTCVRFWSADR